MIETGHFFLFAVFPNFLQKSITRASFLSRLSRMSPRLTVVWYRIFLSRLASGASLLRTESSPRWALVMTVPATESILHCSLPAAANFATSRSMKALVTPNELAMYSRLKKRVKLVRRNVTIRKKLGAYSNKTKRHLTLSFVGLLPVFLYGFNLGIRNCNVFSPKGNFSLLPPFMWRENVVTESLTCFWNPSVNFQ